jgi:flagellar motor switch protein FliM
LYQTRLGGLNLADTLLTQAEIDALLASMSGDGAGDESAAAAPETKNPVRPYDFRTANRFPKEQIRTFNIVFQNFAQLFTNQLTALLRTACECEVSAIEESSFNEFNNALPSPVILSILQAPPMSGQLLMSFSPECAYMIINRLLGGVGSGGDTTKPFSEIDLAIIERTLRQICNSFTEAWDRIIALDTTIDRVETSSQFTQIASLNEATIVIMLTIRVNEEEGLFSFCIPHTAIEPIAKALVARNYFNAVSHVPGDIRQQYAEHTRRQVNRTDVEMTAYFNDTNAYVSDIANLRVGDVIRLDHRLDEPLFVRAAHIPKFRVVLGSYGSSYAVRVEENINNDDDEDDESEQDLAISELALAE